MIRPTPLAVVLFGLGIPVALLLVVVEPGLWVFAFAYLCVALVLTGADALLCLPARALALEVRVPPLLYIGERGALDVELTAPGAGQAAALELVCDVGAILARPEPLRFLFQPGQRSTVAVPLIPTRRGTAAVERLWLRWQGPLRLARRRHIHPLGAPIPVVPNVAAVRRAALKFHAPDSPFGAKPQSQQGEGSEFSALREYVPGLDHRSIDWKHSARHRNLLCKEFRTERNHQIILAFDTGHLMSEPLDGIPRLDHAINAGLLLGYSSLRAGDRIGLFAFDSQVRLLAAPAGGIGGFPRLQRASAELAYRRDETNFTLGLATLLGQLRRRSLVIVFTEFVDTVTAELMVENLQRLAARHLVIFATLRDPALSAALDLAPRDLKIMTRAVVADDFLRERRIVYQRLDRLGVHCLEAPAADIGADLLNRYLVIKQKELI